MAYVTRILEQSVLRFDLSLASHSAVDLIGAACLQRDAMARPRASALRTHAFFAPIDFRALLVQKLPPPAVPPPPHVCPPEHERKPSLAEVACMWQTRALRTSFATWRAGLEAETTPAPHADLKPTTRNALPASNGDHEARRASWSARQFKTGAAKGAVAPPKPKSLSAAAKRTDRILATQLAPLDALKLSRGGQRLREHAEERLAVQRTAAIAHEAAAALRAHRERS